MSERRIVLRPIGSVRARRSDPNEDDNWGKEVSTICLSETIPEEALEGLTDFSHVEVVFHLHLVPASSVQTGRRYPRGNRAWPSVGIFAQRAKGRPNRIGVSICKVRRVMGRELIVEGLDAVDGTPVLDIKPVLREFLPSATLIQPAWATELMKEYWSTSQE